MTWCERASPFSSVFGIPLIPLRTSFERSTRSLIARMFVTLQMDTNMEPMLASALLSDVANLAFPYSTAAFRQRGTTSKKSELTNI